MTVRHLDRKYLASMTGGDPAFEAEILTMFFNNAESYLAGLAAATDAESWRRMAHTLKGSAGGVGARRLSDLARNAELSPWPQGEEKARVLAALAEELNAIKLQYPFESPT